MDDERLVQSIYHGAQDDDARARVLAEVADRTRAAGVGLGLQDMRTHRFRSLGQVGIDAALTPTYQRLAPGNAIWREIAVRRQALTDRMVMAKSDLLRTELYADWFVPQRFHAVMAAPAHFDGDASAVIVAFRDRRRGDFEAADLQRFGKLAGHFGEALRLRFAHEQLIAELAAAHFLLDELPDALFLVTGAGRIWHANSVGKAMLASGAPVRSDDGQLSIPKPGYSDRLRQLIADQSGELHLPKPGGGVWIVQVRARSRSLEFSGARAAIVRIIDSDQRGDALDPAKLSARTRTDQRAGAGCGRAGESLAPRIWPARRLASARRRSTPTSAGLMAASACTIGRRWWRCSRGMAFR